MLLPNNDWFLNELCSFLEKLQITQISANYSRYVIDVNRDIDSRDIHNEYTKSLVYQKTTFGQNIYDTPLSDEIISNRIESIYLPYHRCLSEEIQTALKDRSKVFLLDLHSFYIQSTADVVLGTCQGKSCSSEFLNIVYEALVSEGFTVAIDEKGLTGGYIVKYYGSLIQVEAIQMELRYTAYIEDREFGEEELVTKDEELFHRTQRRLANVFAVISQRIMTLE